MKVDFSKFDFNERPTLVLKNLDGTAIGVLGYAFNVEVDPAYNEVSSLSFDIPAEVDGVSVPGYTEAVGMRIVDLVGCGQFLLLDPEEVSDGVRTVKSCKAYSLEYEFAKKDIYLESGTYNFFSGIDTSDDSTIVGRIRERLPDWVFDIDEKLVGRYRTFEDTNKKVYDFIKSDVQEKYGCIFDFDTYSRTVHVVDVTSTVPTKQVFLSKDNLIKEIQTNEDSDSIITSLDVYGADDVTIRSVNPTGLNRIYNLDYFMNEVNFAPEFIQRWRNWEKACKNQQSIYYDITVAYNMKLLQILTAEAEISDIKAKLVAEENVQAAIVQGIAQGAKKQSDLDDVNVEINSLKTSISSKENSAASLKDQASALHERREEINAALAFDKFFSAEEIKILNRYFIEDTFQDDSFVAETAASYIEEDYSTAMESASVSVSGADTITQVEDELGCVVYSVSGGTVVAGSLSGKIIKATLYMYSDGTAVFSSYTDGGTVGSASFANGNVTISGKCNVGSFTPSSLSFTISDGRMYFTEKCTEYKRLQIEWDLYEYAKQLLREKSTPAYNFSVDACNFLSAEEFTLFRNQLTLGERVYLDLDGEVVEPYVVSLHCNFEDPTDFSIEFSSTYTSFDKSFALAKLLEQSVSMGKTLSHNSGIYSAFVNSGASTAVKDFMDSALDISKNAVLSSENQAITFDDTGIRIRKWNADKTGYEPEEIWIVDNMIAFTEDNWAHAKMAIGKIFDPNLKSNDNPQGMAYGIVADYLVGKIIAGQNLIIQATAEDGDTVTFRVDGSGAYLYNADINIVSNGNQVVLSPEKGIAIGATPLYKVQNGKEVLDEDKAKFWVDSQGNLHLKGKLEGCDGIFSGELTAAKGSFIGDISGANGTFKGVIQASKFLDLAGNDMMSNGKFTGDYLDLRGIEIKNGNTTTFKVDADTGAVEINGKVTMSSGSSINWDTIDEDTIPEDITKAYSIATTAAKNATNALNLATSANTNAGDAVSTVNGWRWKNGTEINGNMIASGTVAASTLIGGEIQLWEDDESLVGHFFLREGSSADAALELNSAQALALTASNGNLYLHSEWGGGESALLFEGYFISCYGHLVPDNVPGRLWGLGSEDTAWNEVWAFNYETVSDRDKKNSIEYDMEKYENLFYMLKPTQFKYNDGTGDRYHTGFISQDVGDAIVKAGLSTQDFAGFVKAPRKTLAEDSSEQQYSYHLRYSEFIALNTHMIQKLYKRIDTLETEITELKEKYDE